VGEGSPSYSARLRERARVANVEFTGFLSGEEKAAALSTATILVLPSLHENFGMVVLEAIAAGLPVVVSEHVQLRDFIDANQLGIVAQDSRNSIATALSSALTDSALQTRVAENGRRVVEETYNPARIGKLLATMYLSALSSKAVRSAY
jgi:glycosyltransferase involved in cell wall biosynthesis